MSRSAKIFTFSLIIAVFAIIFGYQLINIDVSSNTGFSNKQLPKLVVRPLDMTGSAGNLVDLRMDIALPDFPSEMKVYKVKKPTITGDQVLAQAKKLGISGEVKETPVDFRVKSPNGDYIVDKATGSFTYFTKEFELQTDPLKTLLSDEEYQKLATDFLIGKGLMKEDAVFRDVNRNNVTLSRDGINSPVPYMIEVRYGSKDLNGIRFGGVGPKIIVIFGESGKITGAFSVWREVEAFKEYPIISIDEALSQIKAGKATIYDASLNDSGVVKEAKLMYHNDPLGYLQEFVIPYYMVTGTNSAGKPFAAFTRAIPENLLKVTSPPSNDAPESSKTESK